jgi:hypothetical protein
MAISMMANPTFLSGQLRSFFCLLDVKTLNLAVLLVYVCTSYLYPWAGRYADTPE